MNKKLFGELVGSMTQMGEIVRGGLSVAACAYSRMGRDYGGAGGGPRRWRVVTGNNAEDQHEAPRAGTLLRTTMGGTAMDGILVMAGVLGWLASGFALATAQNMGSDVFAGIFGVSGSMFVATACVVRAIRTEGRKSRGEQTPADELNV